MPKVYGSYKTGADIYKDPKSKKFYILEWNPQTRETYKKFISFKPTETRSELASLSQATLKNTKMKTKKRLPTLKKQKGGLSSVHGEMTMDICSTEVLNNKSYKDILAQLQLPNVINKYLVYDIKKIRDNYKTKFAGKRLIDVIYELPQPGIKPMLGHLTGQMPKMCWDHGIGNHESITGGAPGIHVYIANVRATDWQLVGVFKRQ
jgi:hypothetical protein